MTSVLRTTFVSSIGNSRMDEVGEDMLIRIVRVQISSHVAIKDLVSTDSSGMASPKRYDFLGGAQTGGQLTYNWWHVRG